MYNVDVKDRSRPAFSWPKFRPGTENQILPRHLMLLGLETWGIHRGAPKTSLPASITWADGLHVKQQGA